MKKKVALLILLVSVLLLFCGIGIILLRETEPIEPVLTEQEEVQQEELPTPVPTFAPQPTATPKPLPTVSPTPIPSPSPTPSPAPTISVTEAPTSEIATEGDGIQDTPWQMSQIFFIGDRRLGELASVANSGMDMWLCDPSADYDWLSTEAAVSAENYLIDGTVVVISLGMDDLYNASSYAELINRLAEQWKEKGVKVYYASIGPVSENSGITNQQIMDFNTYMFQNLSVEGYIDVYNELAANGFGFSGDGNSYDTETLGRAYQYILDCF